MAAAAAGPAIGARAVFAGVDQFAAQLARLGTQFAQFGGQVTGGIEQANEAFAGLTGGLRAFNLAVAGTQLAANTVSTTVSTLTAPFRAVGGAVTGAASEIAEGSSKIAGALKDIADATLSVSEKGAIGVVAIGTALVGLGVTAVTESARYERGMKDISAVTQVTGADLEGLDSTIRRVAARFPSQIGDIQSAVRELGKAGVDVKDLTDTIIQLALAAQNLSSGELTSTGAAEAIGSNMALFRKSFSDAGDTVEQQAKRIINSITGIANETRASIPEVISAINKLGPNLVPLGGTIEQTAALAGIVLKQGPRGQEAGTALANLIQRAEAPSREASKILEKRNLSLFTAEGAPRPAIDFIKDIQDTYGKAGRAVNGLTEAQAANELAEIAQTRVLRTLNLILETGVDDYRELLDAISKTNVLDQAATQNQALIRQLETLRNNAQLAGIAFGRDFVSGLGTATRVLNEFLADGERAQAIAGVIGKATASILTGQGTDESRAAVSDSPFGEEGVRVFDSLNAASEKIKGNIADLTRDAANFGKTLGLIAFPEGLPGAIDATSEAISGLITLADDVVKAFNAAIPEVIADLQKITGAATFEELIANAKAFGKEIATIFSENGGEQDFNRAKDAGVSFLSTLRGELGETIKSAARLAREVEKLLPTLLSLAEKATVVGGIMTRVFIDTANALTQQLGGALGFLNTVLGAYGATFETIGRILAGKGIQSGGIPTNFTTITPAMLEDRRRAAAEAAAARGGVGGGGINPSPEGGIEDAAAFRDADREQQALASLSEEQRAAGPVVDAYTQLLAESAATTDDATTSTANLGNEIGLTQGEFDNMARKAKEAEEAQKQLEAAQKSLSAQMRTLEKDVIDAGGSFDKTISGAQQRWLDGLDQIAESTADAVKRIRRTASEAREKALEGFNLQVERGGGFFASLDEEGNLQLAEDFVEGTNTIFRHGQEDRKREFQHGIEDRQRNRQLSDENETRDVARHNEDITRIEQQGQEDVTRARQIGIEDRERQRQRAQDRELLDFTRAQEREATAFSRTQERQSTGFSRGLEAQATARSRSREDTHASRDLAESLAKARTPEERTKLLTDFTEERRKTAISRQEQDEDTQYAQQQQDARTAYAQQQQDALTRYRQGQEDALTKKRQDLEDQNVAHKRELEVADIDFRRQLEVSMIDFRRGLEDKETERRRTKAALEIAERRKDELETLSFDRTQQQESQLNQLTTQTIPDLQRQLAQINQNETDQLQNTGEQAARQLLRAGLTLRREIQSASVTGVEGLRRLQARFETDAASALERVPESKRPELQAQINAQRQVLAAQVAIAEARQSGRGAQVTGEADQATQAALGQLGAFVPDLSSIQQIFGDQATANLVTTSLLAAPQVERLTKALEDLTTKIDKIQPGVHVDEVNQTIQAPTTPEGAVVSLGTLNPVV